MKKILFILSVVLLAACSSDDDNNNDSNPKDYNGTWVVHNLSSDVEANTEETKKAVEAILTSQNVINSTYLKLKYIDQEKSFEYDYKDVVTGNKPGGEMFFKDNVFTANVGNPKFTVSFQYLYYEYDYKDYEVLKNIYPDLKKATQKLFLKKAN